LGYRKEAKMNKHKATRKAPGWYEYRGWEIEKIEDHWNMAPPGSDEMTDAATTLAEAKALVDRQEN